MEETLKTLKKIHLLIISICVLLLIVSIESNENEQYEEAIKELLILDSIRSELNNPLTVEKFIEKKVIDKVNASIKSSLKSGLDLNSSNISISSQIDLEISALNFSFSNFTSDQDINKLIQIINSNPGVSISVPDLDILSQEIRTNIPKYDQYELEYLEIRNKKFMYGKFLSGQNQFNFISRAVIFDYRNAKTLSELNKIQKKRRGTSLNPVDYYSFLIFDAVRSTIYGLTPQSHIELVEFIDLDDPSKYYLHSWMEKRNVPFTVMHSIKGEGKLIPSRDFDFSLPDYLIENHYKFFPKIHKYLYLISDKPILVGIRTLREKIAEKEQNITLLGFSISYKWGLLAAPLLIFVMALYFLSHILFMKQKFTNSEEIPIFPWTVLYENLIGRIISIITIVVLPIIAISATIMKYWEKSNFQLALAFIFLLLTAVLVIKILHELSRLKEKVGSENQE